MKRIMTRRLFLGSALTAAAAALLPGKAMADLVNFNVLKKRGGNFPYQMPEQQWAEKLGEETYAILRAGHNETAGTSPLLRERRKGTYLCRGCAQPLFASTAKVMANDFPTFRQPINVKSIGLSTDFGIVLPRTEVHCKNCGGHLGYRFAAQDPAAETWRYMINGASLSFQPA